MAQNGHPLSLLFPSFFPAYSFQLDFLYLAFPFNRGYSPHFLLTAVYTLSVCWFHSDAKPVDTGRAQGIADGNTHITPNLSVRC